jgi:cellulose synthase operon protein C
MAISLSRRRVTPVFLLAGAAMLGLSACGRGDDGNALVRAQVHMAQSDFAAARVELLNAARQRPNDPAVHLATAETLLQLGDAVGGAAAAQAAAQAGASPAEVAILLGDAANMSGDAETARRHADDLPAVHAADAARLRGGAMMVSGNSAGAIPLFREGLERRPADYRLHVELGYALLGMGEFGEAAAHAARAVRLSPNRIGPHMLAARSAERQGDLLRALAAYDRVLAISPNYLAALQDRAAVLGDLGRRREMNAMLDRADRVRADHPRTLFLRAKLAAGHRAYREAQSLLSRAGSALDNDVQSRVLSAQIAEGLGMRSLAIAHMRRALILAPGEHQLRIMLAQMLLANQDPAAALAAVEPLSGITPPPVELVELRAAIAAAN